MFPQAPYIDPEIVFVVVKYMIWMYVLQLAVFNLVTVNDWLEKFCTVKEYQWGSPP